MAIRRILPVVLCIVLPPSASMAATRFVATAGSDIANNCMVAASPCSTIQHAVNSSVSGDDIEMAAGIYPQGPQIRIDRDVSLRGAGMGATVIMATADTGSSGDSRGWFLIDPGIVFNLADLSLDGSGFMIHQAIRHKGSGTVERVSFTEIKFPTYRGTAIVAFGGVVDVFDSDFSQIGRVGVLYFGSVVSTSTFQGNTYTGKGAGDHLDYALDISAGATVNVLENFITANRGIASADGSRSSGLIVTTFFGDGTFALIEGNVFEDTNCGVAFGFDTSDTSSAIIRCNRFSGNDDGIDAKGVDGSQISATMNTIAGNEAGINADFTSGMMDAMGNWWGAPDGPSGDGPGSGDTANGPIDFSNFSTTASICAPTPEIDVDKEADVQVAITGTTVVYTVMYSSAGPATASDAFIRETVPAGTTFLAEMSTPGWSCADGSPASTPCDFPLGDVAAGDSGTLDFAVTVLEGSSLRELINRATFDSVQGDIVQTEVTIPIVDSSAPAPAISSLGLALTLLGLLAIARRKT